MVICVFIYVIFGYLNKDFFLKFNFVFCRILYCVKGNYEFGIFCVIKFLEFYNKKLGMDMWYYVKCCFLFLIENMVKYMIMMKD